MEKLAPQKVLFAPRFREFIGHPYSSETLESEIEKLETEVASLEILKNIELSSAKDVVFMSKEYLSKCDRVGELADLIDKRNKEIKKLKAILASRGE